MKTTNISLQKYIGMGRGNMPESLLFLSFKTVLHFFILYDAHCAFKSKIDVFKENRRISCEKHSKECEVNQTRMTS